MFQFKTVILTFAVGTLTAACSGGQSASDEQIETSKNSATDDKPAKEASVDYASLTGDAVAGKKAFAQCMVCHVVDPGVNRTGPSLSGIIGSKAGSVDGFKYSPANANSGITWTEEKLFEFLENPQKIVPKTKMIFAGIPDAQRRADIVAYLKNPE